MVQPPRLPRSSSRRTRRPAHGTPCETPARDHPAKHVVVDCTAGHWNAPANSVPYSLSLMVDMGDPGDVRVGLLGGFSVSVAGRAVPDDAWRLRKAKTLVKLLALAPDRQLHWERIGETLWPDRDAAAARNNLHQALHACREALTSAGIDGRQAVQLRDGMLGFGDGTPLVVDVEAFTAAAAHAHATRSIEAFRAAAAMYDGDLLPEDRYEDWAAERREALREQHSALLLAWAQTHREEGDPDAAADVLRALLATNERHEPARREMMSLLAAGGRRQDALAEFEALRDALRRDLDADPDPQTRQLYRTLLAGSVEQPAESKEETKERRTQDLDSHGSGVEGPESGPATAQRRPARTDNLPASASSFVGREREVAEVERLLATTRLMTLTGVGGVGKTRLALEIARRQREGFADGVWLVDLAPVSEAAAVPQTVADVLDLQLPERGHPLPTLAEQLAPRHLLLLLDNCEHLIGSCAELVTAVLRTCPQVVILATSREALRTDGEVAWRVPSLALPDLGQLPDHATLAGQAAVRLFCERAAAAEGSFKLTSDNAETVARLCTRLDGIPLALELAAARVRVLSPRQILDRLGQALDMLGGGTRSGLTRQRTLSATLDWSHDLLDEAERTAFRRLAVFAGSFDLEASEHVCGVDPLDSPAVLPLLGRLVDKSLVVREPHGDVARFRLLEIVREYAHERLTRAGEHVPVQQRHRDWYCAWAEANDPERAAAAGEEALQQFDTEHGNLRAALRSALVDEPEVALRLATSLWRFWLARGQFADGRRALEAALDVNPAPTALRARGLMAIAVLDMRYAAGHQRLQRVAGEVIDIHQGIDDQFGRAQALHLAGVLLWAANRWHEAEDRLDRASELADSLGAHHVTAGVDHTRGLIALSRQMPDAAKRHFAACRSVLDHLPPAGHGFFPALSPGFVVEEVDSQPRVVFEETLVMGHRLDVGPARTHLRFSQAWAARADGDLDAALACAEESAARFREQSWKFGEAAARHLHGDVLRLAGAHGMARQHLEHSLDLRTRLGDRRATGVSLTALGRLAAAEGDTAAAERYHHRASEVFQRTEDRFGYVAVQLNVAVDALADGQHHTAAPLLRQVQQLRDAPGMRAPSGWVALMLAEISDAQGEADAAAEHRAYARATFTELGIQMGLAYCEQTVSSPPG